MCVKSVLTNETGEAKTNGEVIGSGDDVATRALRELF